ncbi:MAG: gliding motility-associated C-terminal domain-containing protein [Bacteroidia bacterium]
MNKLLHFFTVCAALIFSQKAVAQQKWYVNISTGDNANNGQSATSGGPGMGPYQTIDFAISMANNGDSIVVAPGNYVGGLIIDKALTFLGPNAGIGNIASRTSEAKLLPAATDLSTPVSGSNTLIQILSNNVWFDGFYINGNNTALSSGNNVNGQDIDLSNAISVIGAFSDLRIANNIVANFNNSGIVAVGDLNNANSGNIFTSNFMFNFGSNSAIISCGNGFYAKILGNTLDAGNTGVVFYNFTNNGGETIEISSNTFLISGTGILLTALTGNTSNIYLDKNHFKGWNNTTANNGILVQNCQGINVLEIRKNNLDDFQTAISMMNNDFAERSLIEDTIQNCNQGVVSMTSFIQSRIDSIFMTNNVFNDCLETAIEVFSDSNYTFLKSVGNKIKDCGNGIHLKGMVDLNPSNTAFTNIVNYYIQLSYANGLLVSSNDIDARNCTFNGKTGKTSTHTENFAIEDKLFHFLDFDPFAYIRFKDSTAYVSGNDGNVNINLALDKVEQNGFIHIQNINTFEDVLITKKITLQSHTNNSVNGLDLAVGATEKVTLIDSLNTKSFLHLNSGILDASNGFVSVGTYMNQRGNTGVSAANSSYVIGPLEVVIQTRNNDTLFFPIGDMQDKRSLRVFLQNSVVGSWDKVRAELINGNTPTYPTSGGISHVSEIHYWDIKTQQNLMFDNISYLGTYSTAVHNDEASEATTLRLAEENGGVWQNIGGTGTSNNNGTILSTAAGTYIRSVSLANDKTGKNRLGKANLTAAFDAPNGCFGNGVNFVNNSVAIGSTIIKYEWNFGDTATNADTSNLLNPNYTYLNPGTYKITLKITDDASATATIQKDITIYPKPKAAFRDEMFCYPNVCIFVDTSTIASGETINSRKWTINSTDYATNTVLTNFPAAGKYLAKLVVESGNGCKDSITKTVVYGDSVKLRFNPASPITLCAGDTIMVHANSGLYSYEWSDGSTDSTTKISSPGKYSLLAYSGNMCWGIDEITVNLVPAAIANAGKDTFIDFGSTAVLRGSGSGNTFNWSPVDDIDNPTSAITNAKPSTTTTFYLTVFDTNGCSAIDSVLVEVGIPSAIQVPNLITPNKDGINDVWDLSSVPDIENTTVTVINRWGREVYKSTQYKHDWDGTYKGEPLPDGTYLYIISGSNLFEPLSGPLQIIR